MHAHIVFAHPNRHSLNGQLRDVAEQVLTAAGWSVSVSDLYQMGFNAAADTSDVDFFDLQIEQQVAAQRQTFAPDIMREHELLDKADLIIFQFPLWWYSMPGLLKGYIDRVFSFGHAYGSRQAWAGKPVLVSMTTGAPEAAWTPHKRGEITDIFKHLFVGTFDLCGLTYPAPFVAYGAKRFTDEQREATKRAFAEQVLNMANNLVRG
jgi:NAD(P)H dehydrogenase (quinone)